MTTRMSQPTVPTLVSRIAELSRQLQAERDITMRLRRELAASMLPYSGHTASIVDGLLTITLNSGAVYQRVQHTIDRPGESGFEWVWEKRAPVPGTPAHRIEQALADLPEMAVVDLSADDDALGLRAVG